MRQLKAKIGSWQANCNGTIRNRAQDATTSYAPGELKRRGKYRLPIIREEANATICTTDVEATATSIASEISSAISVSATDMAAAEVTSAPYAGAALSSAVSSGAEIGYNLTSYVTDTTSPATATGAGSSIATPSVTTAASAAETTVRYNGTMYRDGTVTFQKGTAAAAQIGNGMILTGMLMVVGAAFVLRNVDRLSAIKELTPIWLEKWKSNVLDLDIGKTAFRLVYCLVAIHRSNKQLQISDLISSPSADYVVLFFSTIFAMSCISSSIGVCARTRVGNVADIVSTFQTFPAGICPVCSLCSGTEV